MILHPKDERDSRRADRSPAQTMQSSPVRSEARGMPDTPDIEHIVVFLPNEVSVLVCLQDPATVAFLPQNPDQDYQVSISKSRQKEYVYSTAMNYSCFASCINKAMAVFLSLHPI